MEMTKDYLQQRGLQSYIDTGGFLFAELSMGTGKTKLAIDIIQHLKGTRLFKIRVLFICHTIASRDITTPEQFRTWNAYDLIESNQVSLVQYEGLDEIRDQTYDLVIFDEAHLITIRRYGFFRRNHCHSILLLTGTRPDNEEKMNMIRKLCRGNILTYGMVQATKHHTVNDILFKLVLVDMSAYENGEYARLCNKLAKAQRGMPATEFQLKMAINNRMWFIYQSQTKLKAMMYMAAGMRDKQRRFLMFTPTKEQSRILSPYTMYSGKKDIDFRRFCNGEINELCSVKQIVSGANIPDLKYAISQQINSKTHNLQQVAGRLLRGDVNSQATFWVIVLRSTIDEKWVYNATKGIPAEKIKRIELKRTEFEHILID
jgi:superfamily II DNA or RNA helicase